MDSQILAESAFHEEIAIARRRVAVYFCSKAPVPETAKPSAALGSIVRLDPSFDTLVLKNAQIEKLVGGCKFIEGPLWRPSNALWFSDGVGNVVNQWTPDGKVTAILWPGGF